MLFYFLVPVLFLGRRFLPLIAAVSVFGIWYAPIGGTFMPFLQLCFLFAIGMVLAQYELCPTRLMAELATAAAVLLGTFGAPSLWTCLAWAFALLSIALSLREFRGSWPVKSLAFVGACSYSLYIWHYMLIEITGPIVSIYGYQYSHPVVTGIGLTAGCIGFAWLSYRFIELPGQTILRDAILRRRERAAVA
jgi:peptidoglycan/LPS O-acetylase OafA/YrhL